MGAGRLNVLTEGDFTTEEKVGDVGTKVRVWSDMRKESVAKECRKPREPVKGRETDFPWNLQKERDLWTSYLGEVKLI